MAYDRNNIFAKILRGELPAAKIYEDTQTLAFMDAMPQTTGHALIVPKFESENILDLDSDYLAALIKVTQNVARAVNAAFKPDGLRVMQFTGAAAGQTVPHVHFHVMPCYAGQEMKGHAREFADPAVLAEHAKRVKAEMI
jgi:histidine triad (HIT) family protein